nr:lysylphosphatidylglycerol synthase transmembrane domain-containing protein [Streptomyces cyanogenus]
MVAGADAGSQARTATADTVRARVAPATASPTSVTPAGATAPAPAASAEEAASGGAAVAPEAPAPRRRGSQALRTRVGTLAGVGILGFLLWRLGTGALVDGLRRIDTATVVAALAIGGVTTAFSAWRWQLVARGLRLRLPLVPAVADYYRALFLNAALPGGILGDVHRAVRHGQSEGDVRRGVKAVVLERVAGQIALAVAGAVVLLTLPSPVRAEVRGFAPLAALAAVGALAVVLAVRMNRPSARPGGGALRRTLGEARQGLVSRHSGPGVALSSAIVLAGHLLMFVVAARVAGSAAPVAALLPLAVLALLAMGLPLNVGGFGPREGVTAWAFGAAGLGADTGVAVAVVYGVLSLLASLPGAAVLAWRWYETVRRGTPAPAPDAALGDGLTTGTAPTGPGRGSTRRYSRPAGEVSSARYGSKDSARLASSSFPFSAEPREGRPMTPDSV